MKRILERVKLTRLDLRHHWTEFFHNWHQRPLLHFCRFEGACKLLWLTTCQIFIFILWCAAHCTAPNLTIWCSITFSSQYAGGGVTVVGARHHVWWVVAPALLRVGWGLVPAPENKKKAHRHSSAGATGTLCALPTGASCSHKC